MVRGIAFFLERETGPVCVESPYVGTLATRALCSIGEERLARRLLVFGSGLVRRSDWHVAGGEEMLVLDLQRLRIRHEDSLELTLFRSLAVILDAVGDAWDPSGGRGTLGLRHVMSSAAAVLGASRRDRRSTRLAEDIRKHCDRKLPHLAAARGWQSVPRVMNLDLVSR